MTVIRDAVLTATILLLILILDNQPKPVKDEQVPYCDIDYPVAQKHPLTGEWMKGWGRGFGPCSLQDKYFEI